jgi:type IV secretory pathway VirB4 component
VSDQIQTEHAKPTQQFLNIADIRDDVLILRNGELRQVLEITALNFALKSEQEQSAIIYQYQNFLNSLQFPIQILIQSRKLELTNYLLSLQGRMSQSTSPLIRNQIADYIDFINRLINLGQIMEKQFYVVVPLATSQIRARSLIGQLLKRETVAIEEKDLASAKAKLQDRTETIRSGLSSMGLQVTTLNSEQVKQLLYTTYNPAMAGGLSTANTPVVPDSRAQ